MDDEEERIAVYIGPKNGERGWLLQLHGWQKTVEIDGKEVNISDIPEF